MPLTEFKPAPQDTPLVASITPPIEAEVGIRHFHALDPKRLEPDGSPRQFMINVFYPADDCASCQRARLGDILEPAPLSALAAVQASWGLGEVPSLEFSQGLTLQARREAPFKTSAGPCPVLIYYPGGQAHRLSNAAVCEAIAATGYVVFCLDAPRDAPVTVFPDGRAISGPLPHDEDYIWPRVADVRLLLDELEQVFQQGWLDLSQIGMFGASRGGYLSNICAVEDPRIKAAVNMDGFLWGLWTQGTGLAEYPAEFQERARNLRTPILRLLGEQESAEKHLAKFQEESRDCGGDFISISLPGFKHSSFGSVGFLCGEPPKWSSQPVAPEPDLAKIQLLSAILQDFFATYLLKSQANLRLLENTAPGLDILLASSRHPAI